MKKVILIGDMNKKVGDLIPGNKDKVSVGGKLIVDFLKNGKYVLVNGMKQGPSPGLMMLIPLMKVRNLV